MESSKYVIVGAGLTGAATAWSLARRGHEVTVVERVQPATQDGSSHGSARIFRYAYPDRFWVDLVVRARAGYTELEKLSGQQLITPTDSLDFGPLRNPAALAQVLAAAGVEHDVLTAEQTRARWPQIAVDTDVLWHAGAGVIDARSTVHALLAAAVEEGARVVVRWPVQDIEKTATGYRVTAQDGRGIDAERVVVAAGGWLPDLVDRLPLPAGFRAAVPSVQVTQENAYHFPYRDCDQSTPWPTFIHKSSAIQTYSLPGGRDADFRGQKLAEFLGGKRISSAAAQDGLIDPANQERIIDYVTQYLPGLVPEPYATTTCLFTNTPNEDFLVDGVDGITLVSPCSGHGAKFAPLVGDIAADVATGTGRAPDRFTTARITAAQTGRTRWSPPAQ
jgi:sarcosine oxidase